VAVKRLPDCLEEQHEPAEVDAAVDVGIGPLTKESIRKAHARRKAKEGRGR